MSIITNEIQHMSTRNYAEAWERRIAFALTLRDDGMCCCGRQGMPRCYCGEFVMPQVEELSYHAINNLIP